MTYPNDYTPAQRLAHEVRILLTLIELEEEAGPDLTGVFLYQREKIYDLIKSTSPEPTPDGYWISEKPAPRSRSFGEYVRAMPCNAKR